MKTLFLRTFLLTVAVVALAILVSTLSQRSPRERPAPPDTTGTSTRTHIHEKAAERAVKRRMRAAYYHRMLRDPATGQIPPNVRRRELAFAAGLPSFDRLTASKSGRAQINWQEAGPTDVGGRTRALAVDRTNSNVVLAGGVAGGVWKSTDGGASWALKSDPIELPGITYITQDPRPGQNQTWLAVSGELVGSNQDRGVRAFVYGPGLYVSTDNGESWRRINVVQDPARLDSPYDFGLKVLVSPTTGTIFTASQPFGLNRLETPDSNPSIVLGATFLPLWTDFDISSDGAILAVTSEGLESSQTESPGVFYSSDDGQTWDDITPAGFPEAPGRAVVAFAPSDPDLAYLWTLTGTTRPGNNAFGQVEDMQFYALDLDARTSEDRTANLPDFGGQVGHLFTQGGYDMVMAVKPDDPDDVFIGGTNLYRSRDAFATPADNIARNWVGGYAIVNNISTYFNHYPDQHALFFDPQNPDALWSGHDSGLSFAPDVNATNNAIVWQDKSEGYNVTQYFHVALAPDANDDRLLGGTQDNGSPFFRFDINTASATASDDVGQGDGGYAYLGDGYSLASRQQGQLLQLRYNAAGTPLLVREITPLDASGQLFINPFAVDRIDESVLYYPAGASLWRAAAVPESPRWSRLLNIGLPSGYNYSTLASAARAADQSLTSTLYLAASGDDRSPLLFRLDEATTSDEAPVDISIPNAPSDAYIHGIAVNPSDGNELLVVMSNYNITGLYHSTDAGASFTAVEGNLTGNADAPGPSLRSATILPLSSGALYLVGASTGVFSTDVLAGNSTQWVQEARPTLGNTIVEFVTSRPSDGRIAVATHGRGLFVGDVQLPVANEDAPSPLPSAFALHQNHPNPFNPSTTLSFTLAEASRVHVSVYNVTGRKIQTLLEGRLLPSGRHTVHFDAGTLPSGMYIYELEAFSAGASRALYKESRVMALAK